MATASFEKFMVALHNVFFFVSSYIVGPSQACFSGATDVATECAGGVRGMSGWECSYVAQTDMC
jgi:hypothetical protein